MAKNNKGKKEPLPYHIVKDSQNFLRVTVEGVSKKYSKIPKKLRSSLIIVVGIFAIVLIALFADNQNSTGKRDLANDPTPGLSNIVVDEMGQFQANIPNFPGVQLDGSSLSSWVGLDETEYEVDEDDISQTTIRVVANPEEVEGVQPRDLTIIYPLRRQGAIITDFGWYLHPILEVWRYHIGVDIRAKKGDMVMAAEAGEVVQVEEEGLEGIVVTIDHGNGWKTVYGQLGDVKVKVGDKVVKGGHIGDLGQSAAAIEPHLHFEIHQDNEPINPRKLLP